MQMSPLVLHPIDTTTQDGTTGATPSNTTTPNIITAASSDSATQIGTTTALGEQYNAQGDQDNCPTSKEVQQDSTQTEGGKTRGRRLE